MKKAKGFTLLELIVVIAIIGILAAVLIPSISDYMANSRMRSTYTEAQEVYNAAQTYLRQLETQGKDASLYFGDGSDNTAGLGYLGVDYSRTDPRNALSGASDVSKNQPVHFDDIMCVGSSVNTSGITDDMDCKAVEAANFIANQLSADFDGAYIVFVYPKTYTVAYVLYTAEPSDNSSYKYEYEALKGIVNDYGCLSKLLSDSYSEVDTVEGIVRYSTASYSGTYVGQYPLPCDIDGMSGATLNTP